MTAPEQLTCLPQHAAATMSRVEFATALTNLSPSERCAGLEMKSCSVEADEERERNRKLLWFEKLNNAW